jgi:hypothetical protein
MSAEAPDFNQLVGPFLQRVPEASRPTLLASLERVAAGRYRAWAEQVPARAAGLRRCAEREEQVAAIAERLFPSDAEGRERIARLVPEARSAYEAVFAELPLREQWRIQAIAERTGAAAWRALAAGRPDATRDALLRCAALEEESALHLDTLVASD